MSLYVQYVKRQPTVRWECPAKEQASPKGTLPNNVTQIGRRGRSTLVNV